MTAQTDKRTQTLRPVHPNAGIAANYRRRLLALIAEMNVSVLHWLSATYRANAPLIAQDELPATALKRAMSELAGRWQKRFDELAPKLARHFAQSVAKRSDLALRKVLRVGGFTVEFKMTDTQRDVMGATIAEQVGLIKSIPQRYMTQVEGAVMRSVQAGRDLAPLAREIERTYGVTRRRAALIARDQNNKATATLTRVRQVELGITEAVWMHSGGGKEPRPTHLAAGRRKQKYDVREGWFDPDADGNGKGRHIFPGELINCRCVSLSVAPGFA